MCIRISENSKRKAPGAGNFAPNNNPIKRDDKRGYQPMHPMSKSSPETDDGLDNEHNYHEMRHRDPSPPPRMPPKDNRRHYRDQDIRQPDHQDPRVKQDNYGYSYDNRARAPQYDVDDQPRISRHSNVMSGGGNMPQQSFLHNPLANSRQDNKMKHMPMSHGQNLQSLDHHLNDSLDLHQNISHTQDSYVLSDMIQNPSMNDMIGMPRNSDSPGISHLDQYALPRNASNSIDNSVMNNPGYLSNAGSLQSAPMNSIVGLPSNSGGRVSSQYASVPQPSSSMGQWSGGGVATTSMYNQSVPNYLDALIDVCEQFHNILPIPKNATNTVYVEGIPVSTREREVARKSIS